MFLAFPHPFPRIFPSHPGPGAVYVAGSLGHGGHSAEILQRLDHRGRLLAFDVASHELGTRMAEDERMEFFQRKCQESWDWKDWNWLKWLKIGDLRGYFSGWESWDWKDWRCSDWLFVGLLFYLGGRWWNLGIERIDTWVCYWKCRVYP